MSAEYDVLVVGAGPAGSTSASLLAGRGYRVALIEKEHFPRPHVGESLLPLGAGVLERLGVGTPPAVFTHKPGAEFICETSGRRLRVGFDEALPGPPRHAWQVERAPFDLLLCDRARAAGAEVHHGEHVREVEIDPARVVLRTPTRTLRGRFLIDASGQGRLMATRARAVEPYRGFGVAAAYQHFDGVADSPLNERGDIRIMMHSDGWSWVIPLPGRRVSVGIVTRRKGLRAESVRDYVAASPLLRAWTRGARASAPALVGNYSYRNRAPYGPRYVCIGDAACFLDPVFSSGVSLALFGAERAADYVERALAQSPEDGVDLMASMHRALTDAYTTFSRLIGRFYNTRMVSNLFFDAPPDAALRPGIVSVLAGDVWRDDNPFQNMLARSRTLDRSS